MISSAKKTGTPFCSSCTNQDWFRADLQLHLGLTEAYYYCEKQEANHVAVEPLEMRSTWVVRSEWFQHSSYLRPVQQSARILGKHFTSVLASEWFPTSTLPYSVLIPAGCLPIAILDILSLHVGHGLSKKDIMNYFFCPPFPQRNILKRPCQPFHQIQSVLPPKRPRKVKSKWLYIHSTTRPVQQLGWALGSDCFRESSSNMTRMGGGGDEDITEKKIL